MKVKVIKKNDLIGICANLLIALEEHYFKKEGQILDFEFKNLIYTNDKCVWGKFFKRQTTYKNDNVEFFSYKPRKKFFFNYMGNKNKTKVLYNKILIKKIRSIFFKNIEFVKEIYTKAALFAKKKISKKTLSVHLRGTDRFHVHAKGKRNLFNFEKDILPKIIYEKKKRFCDKIYLVTDEYFFIKKMYKHFKKDLILPYSKIIDKNNNSNAVVNLINSERIKTRLGEEALIECLIMSKCKFNLLSKSNMGLTAILLRNDMNYKFIDENIFHK